MRTIIIFLVGFFIGKFYARRQAFNSSANTEVNSQRHLEKEAAKGRVMELFEGKSEIGNDDVETRLGVSDATATRYLDELEEEGKIVQIGETGSGVKYRLNDQ